MPFETDITQESGHSVITLIDTKTGCQAEIYGFGGLLNAFRISSEGNSVNVIDGFSSVQDAIDNVTKAFKSAKLSPFVCRMNRGKYNFEGSDFLIQKYFLAKHAIHGLLYDGVFEITGTESGSEKASVSMKHEYRGTDKGYPFSYTMHINWKLESGNKLSAITTLSHKNKTAIPVADGWHPYFTLGGSIDDCTLQFDSTRRLEFDSDLIPTREKLIDNRFANGISLKGIALDNSFELDTGMVQAKCILQNDTLRLTIEPDKSYPILQVYTPSHRNSIAIENLSGAPDNFNNGMGLILLARGKKEVFTVSYSLQNTNT
jgi:aldose 1-epimerase